MMSIRATKLLLRFTLLFVFVQPVVEANCEVVFPLWLKPRKVANRKYQTATLCEVRFRSWITIRSVIFFFAVSTEVSVVSCVEFPSLMMVFYKMRVYLRRNWLFESSLLFLFLALRNFLVRKITNVALAS